MYTPKPALALLLFCLGSSPAPSGQALGTQAARSTAPNPTDPAETNAANARKLLDWPDLKHYQAANKALPPPAAGEHRVVFFGSSTTEFWGKRAGAAFFPGRPYVNRGISGQTTPQMLVRFQQDVVALKPKVVVFLGGSNDIAGNTGPTSLEAIQDNIRSMVAIATANGIVMVLASQLPTTDYPWNPGTHPEGDLLKLSTWEKSFAAEQHLIYADYYTALAGKDGNFLPGLSVDGVHPTAAGYKRMEPVAEAAIAKALSRKHTERKQENGGE